TRRNELQANCLGGVFLGASGPSLGLEEPQQQNILDDVVRRSDRGRAHTHGSVENSRLWTVHGMDRGDPAACNTWVAGEELGRGSPGRRAEGRSGPGTWGQDGRRCVRGAAGGRRRYVVPTT